MTTTPDTLVERLRDDVRQLTKMVEHAKMAGPETGVRVKDPSLLLADLSDAATRLDQLERELADAREVLSLIDGEGIRAESINAPEDATVEALCEHIGYGAVMDAAARLWFRKDPVGSLTVGPCAGTVRAAIRRAGEVRK